MEKLLVGLNVPAVRQRYDMFVPQDMVIEALVHILADGLSQLTDGRYLVSGEEKLTLTEPDLLLNPAFTLADYGVMDGAQLVLL